MAGFPFADENFSSSNSLRVYGSYRKERTSSRTIQIHLSRWRRLDWDETIFFWSISFLFREGHNKKAHISLELLVAGITFGNWILSNSRARGLWRYCGGRYWGVVIVIVDTTIFWDTTFNGGDTLRYRLSLNRCKLVVSQRVHIHIHQHVSTMKRYEVDFAFPTAPEQQQLMQPLSLSQIMK